MREDGLREVYVVAAGGTGIDRPRPARPTLQLVEGPLSTTALADYLARLGVELQPGWRAEINLRAVEWVRNAARRLRRGFMILVDYGHEARELYSASHSGGTLATCTGHRSAGPESAGAPAWLQSPGARDITAHVDFTSVRAAAEAEGLQTLGFLDQTYFLLGLFLTLDTERSLDTRQSINHFKTLIMPGGLGSTHKVLIFGKGVGTPALRGCSYRQRVT
jgi:SAM-dependent MidA family methyltransferase